jgi:hemerythrin
MAFMIWQPDYEFGIPDIDKQHKHFLDLLNRFYDGLAENNMKNHLVALLNEALDYAHYHFSEEERMMKDIGYGAILEQRKMHSSMESKIEEYKEKIVLDRIVVSLTMTNEFRGWFNDHILGEDKKYVDLYKNVNSGK